MFYKVVVVDDSPFMRKIISDLIERDSSFQVVGTAVNGWEALMKVSELKPDIVTMDVEMPEMNGLEALKAIMKDNPLPVIMLSGINEEGMRETIIALESGAFDFIHKPSASVSNDINQVGELLLEKMNAAMQAKERRAAWQAQEFIRSEERRKQVDKKGTERAPKENIPKKAAPEPLKSTINKPPPVKVNTTQHKVSSPEVKTTRATKRMTVSPKVEKVEKVAKLSKDKQKPLVINLNPPAEKSSSFEHLIAIGCSTGGPRALKELLERIPSEFSAPVVIVQHMPPKFTKSLAQRLNTFSTLEVMEGEHGMVLHRGCAYIAPGGYHMTIVLAPSGNYEISLSLEEPCNGHRPSADTMFDSLFPLTTLNRHVVLLTGMGSDGARAMKRLYDSGVMNTYAESEETCVVYGMPRSAVELQCVSHILPLQEIPNKLVQMMKNGK